MPIWKQFVHKFPKKSSKHDRALDHFSTRSGGSNRSTTSAKRMSSVVFPASVVAGIEPLLPFKDVAEQQREKLVISKLNFCCTISDFSDPEDKDSAQKDIKRRILLELVDHVSAQTTTFGELVISAACRMIMENLCRTFPPRDRNRSPGGENDEDPPVYYPAWWHLQIVYEFLVKFISSSAFDARTAKRYLDNLFISRLLELFNSEDPRERDCLKTVLHRIYGKFMFLRPSIRKAVSNILYTFAFETQQHNGITDLLEVFGSIIGGFDIPLKEEHKVFLCRTLIPLHKPKNIGMYHQELMYCLTQFLEKEPKLSSTLISGLLKYWPVTNSQKEVMFLSELEEVLEAATMVEFQKIMIPVFWQIACCVNSLHHQVAERALFLWNNDYIVGLIRQNSQVILPIVFPALESNVRTHWNQSVINATHNVRKIFSDMDEELFLACQKKLEEEEKQQTALDEKRKMTWEKLESLAGLNFEDDNEELICSREELPAYLRCTSTWTTAMD